MQFMRIPSQDSAIGHADGRPPAALSSLTLEAIVKSIKGARILSGVSINASKGSITGIIGPNGAGKSTLLNIACGLTGADAGRILLDGQEIGALPIRKRARRGLVRTFQITREFGELTVFENMLTAGTPMGAESVAAALFGLRAARKQQAETAAKAHSFLEMAGLLMLADAPAKTLSGGQKKLLELVRALMLDPKVLLLDEPAAGVSPPLRLEISALIKSLKQKGKTILIVEHDMDVVAALCDYVYVIAEGANLTSGSFQEITADKRVIDAYLGGVV
jgi:ABC-type branched-subunit amino acid transport system ATPase component